MSSIFYPLILNLILLSCNKSLTSPGTQVDDLVGVWKIQKGIQTNCADPADNHSFTYTDGCYTDARSGNTTCITISFTKDGKYSVLTRITPTGGQAQSLSENGTYTVSGSTLTTCIQGDPCEKGTFSVISSSLNVVGDDTVNKCHFNTSFIKS